VLRYSVIETRAGQRRKPTLKKKAYFEIEGDPGYYRGHHIMYGIAEEQV
jgi:hypothetical protein